MCFARSFRRASQVHLPGKLSLLAERLLAAGVLDLRKRRVTPSAANVIAYATDTGMPGDIAVGLGRMVESDEDDRLAA